MEVYLLTLTGPSGNQFNLLYEADDIIDVEFMVRDTGINAIVEGRLEQSPSFIEASTVYIQ